MKRCALALFPGGWTHLPDHLLCFFLFFIIKADMSVTSLTSHNIGCPQEITIQVLKKHNIASTRMMKITHWKKYIHDISPHIRYQHRFFLIYIS